jgi:glycerol-3-phosphate cytidylyltransferase-like family protein
MQDGQDFDRMASALKVALGQDRALYDSVWHENYATQPAMPSLLSRLKFLAASHNQTPTQPCEDLESLDGLADRAGGRLHECLRAIVIGQHGEYVRADRKSKLRSQQKIDDDYDGDCSRLLDMERSMGLFHACDDFDECISELQSSKVVRLVRAKDRLNAPLESGYRDILLNVQDVQTGFVAELQLSFHKIAGIKSQAHRLYELARVMKLKLVLPQKQPERAEESASPATDNEAKIQCGYCAKVIEGTYITALGQNWHEDHFVCTVCATPFSNHYRKYENKPYCEEHFRELFAEHCAQCGKVIEHEVFEAAGKKYHLDCFVCGHDGHKIEEGVSFHVFDNKVYCVPHFEELMTCKTCNTRINGQYLKVIDKCYHPDCWKCATCGITISAENCGQYQMQFYCKPCTIIARTGRPAVAAKPVSASAAGGTFVPPSMTVPYSALTNNLFDKDQVDSNQKEMYLSDGDFLTMFKMSKSQFNSLPAWKKKQLKQSFNLF